MLTRSFPTLIGIHFRPSVFLQGKPAQTAARFLPQGQARFDERVFCHCSWVSPVEMMALRGSPICAICDRTFIGLRVSDARFLARRFVRISRAGNSALRPRVGPRNPVSSSGSFPRLSADMAVAVAPHRAICASTRAFCSRNRQFSCVNAHAQHAPGKTTKVADRKTKPIGV